MENIRFLLESENGEPILDTDGKQLEINFSAKDSESIRHAAQLSNQSVDEFIKASLINFLYKI